MSRQYDKTLIINLPSPWLISDRDVSPLGALYLAASLREREMEVQISDLAGIPEEYWQLPDADLYAIGLTTPQYPYAKKVIQKLRERTKKEVTIIGGGPHVSALPLESMVGLDLDYAIVGEADESFPDFVMGVPYEWIPGLCWWSKNADGSEKWNWNPAKPPSVDKLPLPARDCLDIWQYHTAGTNNYVLPSAKYEGYVISTRGCPMSCAFCAARSITGGRVRYRPIDNVIKEVIELRDKYDCSLVYLDDDTFNIKRDRTIELSRALGQTGVPWHVLCRVDHLDDELLREMHDNGCLCITFGLESGSNAILSKMRKGTTVEQGLRACEMVHKAGMKVRGQFIVGFPGENDDTIRETEDFVRRVSVDKFGFHAFVPLPGSDVWEHPERYGLAIDKANVDFGQGFQTIGRPKEWTKIYAENEDKAREWLDHLIAVTKERNIFVGDKKLNYG